MKPDWDKLMTEFADSATGLVADVDCTAAGKSLCETHGVKGYPTIKWGDPAALEDYQGGRDFDSLQKFASESLKPMCSPNNIDLCDDEKKAEIEKVQAMSDEELAGAITKFEDMNNSAEETFKTEVQKLQDTYQALMKAKDDAVEEVKAAGLGLMKSVQSSKAKAAGNSEL
uniref:Thioredoxin domain-containing protein n=1 Tax=Noctiluca scintillans TaxID=2966 RepID=A0A7S1ARR7_NOCSC|mmetsp:Transcript_60296/g.70467  ORF Transcript_60296/g.70467 Transcript_60296/m.70467 type:complete len:171 (+) Transcript_60296:208-720(+)